MIDSEHIHESIQHAKDLENIRGRDISVAEILKSLAAHPSQIIRRWNWKSALMGAIFRGSFYFAVYQASKESWVVTITAVLVELSFRVVTSGISGALLQSFRRATPPWLAMTIISISLPAFGHTVEFISHYTQEAYFYNVFAPSQNSARQNAFAISVFISVISALFNIFMMRNGVLIVGAGDETMSLWNDVKNIPSLIYEFTLFLPRTIIKHLAELNFHYALGIILSFGVAVGAILGIFRGKLSWAIKPAIYSSAILLSATILLFLFRQIYAVITRK